MSKRVRVGFAVRKPILGLLLAGAIVTLVGPGVAGSRVAAGPSAAGLPSTVSLSTMPDRQGVIVVGQPLRIQGTVQAAEPGTANPTGKTTIPTGRVRVLVNGELKDGAPAAVLDKAGHYTLPDFLLPLIVNPPAPVYPLAISVAYEGDGVFAPSVSPATKATVYASDTVTTLDDEKNPSPFARTATFRAHVAAVVASLGAPSGAVMFELDGISSSGTIPLDAKGNAAWTASPSIGRHVISATYVPVKVPFTTSRAELKHVVSMPQGRVAAGLTVMPVPLRGRRVGFRFSGELRPPAGFPLEQACAGTVSVVLAHGSIRVTKTVRVARDCRYILSASFPTGAKLGRGGRIRTTTMFSGNKRVRASRGIALDVPYGVVVPVPVPCGGGASGLRIPGARATSASTNPCLPPWVVTLGDSYMAGEGGRWAGNSAFDIPPFDLNTDALGPSAYFDNLTNDLSLAPDLPGAPVIGTGEVIQGCHRSRTDEAFIGGGVKGLDLACSGATTSTEPVTTSGLFKPGVDFWTSPGGSVTGPRIGQAMSLFWFANPAHRIAMVVIGVGGNDFGFGDILVKCVTAYMTSHNVTTPAYTQSEWYYNGLFDFGWHDVSHPAVDHRSYCSEDASVTNHLNDAPTVTAKVAASITDAAQALATEGYRRNDYTIVVQTVPAPVAHSGPQMRYGEGLPYSFWDIASWFDKPRQWIGGCGFWDKDLDWMLNTAVPVFNSASVNAAASAATHTVTMTNGSSYKPRIKVLDMAGAFDGHRLCEKGQTPQGGYPDVVSGPWNAIGSVDRAEWINQIHILQGLDPQETQEYFHPNYWGQLAQRACVRLAYNHGNPRGGQCLSSGLGLDTTHNPREPRMTLQ